MACSCLNKSSFFRDLYLCDSHMNITQFALALRVTRLHPVLVMGN